MQFTIEFFLQALWDFCFQEPIILNNNPTVKVMEIRKWSLITKVNFTAVIFFRVPSCCVTLFVSLSVLSSVGAAQVTCSVLPWLAEQSPPEVAKRSEPEARRRLANWLDYARNSQVATLVLHLRWEVGNTSIYEPTVGLGIPLEYLTRFCGVIIDFNLFTATVDGNVEVMVVTISATALAPLFKPND